MIVCNNEKGFHMTNNRDIEQIAKDLELLDRDSASNICYGDPYYARSLEARHGMSISEMRELILNPLDTLPKANTFAGGWQPMETAPETGNGDWLPNEAKRGQALIVRFSDGRTMFEAFKKHNVWAYVKWHGGHTVTSSFYKVEPIAWMHLPIDPQ